MKKFLMLMLASGFLSLPAHAQVGQDDVNKGGFKNCGPIITAVTELQKSAAPAPAPAPATETEESPKNATIVN